MSNKLSFILIPIAVILLSSVSFAQIELKPSVGINLTAFSNDPANTNTSAQLGWQLGGSISIGDKFYGEGGIFWVHKSNKITQETTDFEFDTELSGIRIPLSVGYHLLGKETGIVGLRALGGASMFFLSNVTVENFSSDDFESANYGVFLGLGLNFTMFFVDVKYEWSLSDVTSVKEFDLGQSKSLYINGGIRLSL